MTFTKYNAKARLFWFYVKTKVLLAQTQYRNMYNWLVHKLLSQGTEMMKNELHKFRSQRKNMFMIQGINGT